MWEQLEAAIIGLINNQVAVNPQWIYNYEPTKPAGYPAIAVVPADGTGVFADTQRNRRSYIFTVKVYQERQSIGSQDPTLVPQQEAERVMRALVDSIIQVFDLYANYALAGSNLNVPGLVFVKPIPSTWGYINSPDVDIRIANIRLEAVVVQ